MAQPRISMRKLREVLRLKYELGLSDRQAAESCGISRRTISQYWELAQKSGIDWSKAQGLTDTELELSHIIEVSQTQRSGGGG